MSPSTLLSVPSPSIILHNGKPATTSLEVARFFGKRHDSVLRDVRLIIDATPHNFRLHNFVESSYLNDQGKEQPMFILLFDGFILLVMGYTGKKAFGIKLMYIEAFNAMQKKLSTPEVPTPDTTRPSRRSDPERKSLTAIINTWVGMAPIHYAAARSQVNAHFGVASVDNMTIGQVKEAIQWVQAKIEGLQKAFPQPSKVMLPRLIDEAPFLEFINEVQAAHEEVDRILSRLHHSVFTLSWKVAEALEKRGDIRMMLIPDMAFDSTLRGYLCHSVYHGVRKALTAPGRQLDEYSNPGYPLLGIVRQLNGR